MVTVNGEPKDIAGKNLHQYLLEEGFDINRVVVERNLEIISKDKLDTITIQDEDSIEVLRFVGGG
ncbi:MAG: sulfur carrier protein ThiS [Muricoprocola sp.]